METVTIGEIAERLGVKRSTVDHWRTTGVFLTALNDVGRPRWEWSAVEGWALETGRLPLAVVQAEVLPESSDPIVDAPRENQAASAPRMSGTAGETSNVEHAPIERPALAGLCRSLVALGDPAIYVAEHGAKADVQKALAWLRGYLRAISGGPVEDCDHPKDKIKRLTWGTVCEACSTRIS